MTGYYVRVRTMRAAAMVLIELLIDLVLGNNPNLAVQYRTVFLLLYGYTTSYG